MTPCSIFFLSFPRQSLFYLLSYDTHCLIELKHYLIGRYLGIYDDDPSASFTAATASALTSASMNRRASLGTPTPVTGSHPGHVDHPGMVSVLLTKHDLL